MRKRLAFSLQRCMGWDFGDQSSHLHIRCILLTTASSPHLMPWKRQCFDCFLYFLIEEKRPNVVVTSTVIFFLLVLHYLLAMSEWEEKTPEDQAVQ